MLVTVHILFLEGSDHAGGTFSAGIGHAITDYSITVYCFLKD